MNLRQGTTQAENIIFCPPGIVVCGALCTRIWHLLMGLDGVTLSAGPTPKHVGNKLSKFVPRGGLGGVWVKAKQVARKLPKHWINKAFSQS